MQGHRFIVRSDDLVNTPYNLVIKHENVACLSTCYCGIGYAFSWRLTQICQVV